MNNNNQTNNTQTTRAPQLQIGSSHPIRATSWYSKNRADGLMKVGEPSSAGIVLPDNTVVLVRGSLGGQEYSVEVVAHPAGKDLAEDEKIGMIGFMHVNKLVGKEDMYVNRKKQAANVQGAPAAKPSNPLEALKALMDEQKALKARLVALDSEIPAARAKALAAKAEFDALFEGAGIEDEAESADAETSTEAEAEAADSETSAEA